MSEQAKITEFDPHDPSTWVLGKSYLVDGHLWAKCGRCYRVIRVDGFWNGMHVCE